MLSECNESKCSLFVYLYYAHKWTRAKKDALIAGDLKLLKGTLSEKQTLSIAYMLLNGLTIFVNIALSADKSISSAAIREASLFSSPTTLSQFTS